MYNATDWKDRVVDSQTGAVIQEGTNQSAGNFNNMEKGIFDGAVASAFLMIAAAQLKADTAAMEKTVQLTNTQSYPFNNSQQTVSLGCTKTTTAYSVDVEVLEHSGDVGDVIIYDKLLNGFKIRYDGSAKNAKLKLIIKGGM